MRVFFQELKEIGQENNCWVCGALYVLMQVGMIALGIWAAANRICP